jgi:hypothetical protein
MLREALGLTNPTVVQETAEQLERARLNPATFTHLDFLNDDVRFEKLCGDCNILALKYATEGKRGAK